MTGAESGCSTIPSRQAGFRRLVIRLFPSPPLLGLLPFLLFYDFNVERVRQDCRDTRELVQLCKRSGRAGRQRALSWARTAENASTKEGSTRDNSR